MKKILTSLAVAVILLSAVGITTAKAGDTLTMAQPLLLVSGVQKSGSFLGKDLDNFETSRKFQENLFTWEKLLKLVSQHPNIKVGKYILHRIPASDIFNTPGSQNCRSSIVIPNDITLQDLLGITYAMLIEAGHSGGISVDYIKGRTTYSFDVPLEYCNGGNGNGGSPSTQNSFTFILLLLLATLLAALIAGRSFGGRKQQTINI